MTEKSLCRDDSQVDSTNTADLSIPGFGDMTVTSARDPLRIRCTCPRPAPWRCVAFVTSACHVSVAPPRVPGTPSVNLLHYSRRLVVVLLVGVASTVAAPGAA